MISEEYLQTVLSASSLPTDTSLCLSLMKTPDNGGSHPERLLQSPLFHMIQFLPHPKLQGSFCNIYKFYGVMKVRGSMSGRFTSKMKVFFLLLIYRKHLPNLLFARFVCFFFLFGRKSRPTCLIIQL